MSGESAALVAFGQQRRRTHSGCPGRQTPYRPRALALEQLEERRVLSGWATGGEFAFFTDAAATTPGLVGSYVNENLRSCADHDDWRTTQRIAGTRIDLSIDFPDSNWGSRAEVGVTHGSDQDWDQFSVQWDGYVQISRASLSLSTYSDDSSRMWIDINRDGIFETSGSEFVNNHWGSSQAPTVGQASPLLAPGLYPIRIQYEEEWWGNILQLIGTGGPMIRAAYVIPSNRTPQPHGVDNLRETLQYFQNWYRNQMERNGFGDKTFLFETEADGVTPRVHTVHVAETDDYLRGDIWGRVSEAASAAGVPLWNAGQVWLLVPEVHVQQPDGSIDGGVALGAGWGSGIDGGVAMIGSNGLAFLNSDDLVDDTLYHGQIRPEIGPLPLVQNVSFPWFEGDSFSTLSSTYLGAALHELTHGFAMPHDFRNDDNADGNLMGNGLRGFRGAVYPDSYPDNNCRLSYGMALALSTNRYFNPYDPAPETNRPTISITTSGAVDPQGGLLQISFSAADSSGLASALLVRQGDLIEEVSLEGTTVNHTFATAHYAPGTTETYEIVVYDVYGNLQSGQTSIVPTAGANRAPVPKVKISRSTVPVGAAVVLDATHSSDPDHPSASLSVEWDLNGDGVFDTAATTNQTLVVQFPEPGTRLIQARLTDPAGAHSLSAPLAIRVERSNQPPVVAALEVSPRAVVRPAELTLTATGVSDVDGTVARVEFYDGDELLGSDVNPDDGWSLVTSTANWRAGEHTFFARALDDAAAWSEMVSGHGTIYDAASNDASAPVATLAVLDIALPGGTAHSFTLTFADDLAVAVATLDNSDVHVRGPGFFRQQAALVSVDSLTNGPTRTATYQITAPGGVWDAGDSGVYEIWMAPLQVGDTSCNYVPLGRLGTFLVTIDPERVGDVADEPAATVSDDRFELIEGQLRLRPGRSLSGTGAPTVDLLVTVPDASSQQNQNPLAIPVSLETAPWRNPTRRLDVNQDSVVSPLDALLIINFLNSGKGGVLRLVPAGTVASPPLRDVNGDHHASPIDALQVINYLNGGSGAGEATNEATNVAVQAVVSRAWQRATARETLPRSADAARPGAEHEVPGSGLEDGRLPSATPTSPDRFSAAWPTASGVRSRKSTGPTDEPLPLENILDESGEAPDHSPWA